MVLLILMTVLYSLFPLINTLSIEKQEIRFLEDGYHPSAKAEKLSVKSHRNKQIIDWITINF